MPVILGGNTSIYLASLTPPAPSLLLDIYTGAAVAYSLRKLRTAYTGAAIRVRRSSDNAEQDINFVGGDLDTQSLLDFVGYNLLTYSEDFTQPTPIWNKFQTSITANVEIAPDGSLTGDKLVESAVSGFHYVDRTNFPITNGLDYNISIYLKQAERTKILFTSAISGTNTSFAVDLTNGNISDNGFANTPIVTSEANGWYRVSLTITSGTTSAAPLIRIFTYNSSNQTNYTGNGTSGVYVWGFQLSQSSSVKPYGKTTTDVARNGFITTWYDQSGNGFNVTNFTAAQQPSIVTSGVIVTMNGKPAINDYATNTINKSLQNTTFNGSSNHYSFNVLKHNATSQLLFNNNAGGYILSSQTGTNVNINSGVGTVTYRKNGVNVNYSTRGVVYTDLTNQSLMRLTADTSLWTQFRIGYYTGGFNTYRLQEIIIYHSDQSTNEVGIETNINDYYSIY
jgi:hypothetical protein